MSHSVALLFFLAFTVLPCPARAAVLDAAGIEKILAAPGVTTPDAFIARLPPELLENFALLRSSNSSQEATPLEPRALLFGPDAKLILTFNGSTSRRGGDRIELVHFDETSQSPIFRELVFSGGGARGKLSDANPSRCLGCHGKRPNWIWDAYETWPSAYGESDDGLLEGTDETNDFRAFRKSVEEKHPRYGSLVISKEDEFHPYYNGVEGKSSFGRNLSHMPNTRLTLLLTRLNARRIVALLKQSPRWNRYRAALAWLAGGCDRSEEAGAKLDTVLRELGVTAVRDIDMTRTVGESSRVRSARDGFDFSDGVITQARDITGGSVGALVRNLVLEELRPELAMNLYRGPFVGLGVIYRDNDGSSYGFYTPAQWSLLGSLTPMYPKDYLEETACPSLARIAAAAGGTLTSSKPHER